MAFTQRSSLLNYLYLQVHHCKICLLDEIIFLLEFLKGENKCSVMKPLRILLLGFFLHVCKNIHLDKVEAVRKRYRKQ